MGSMTKFYHIISEWSCEGLVWARKCFSRGKLSPCKKEFGTRPPKRKRHRARHSKPFQLINDIYERLDMSLKYGVYHISVLMDEHSRRVHGEAGRCCSCRAGPPLRMGLRKARRAPSVAVAARRHGRWIGPSSPSGEGGGQ